MAFRWGERRTGWQGEGKGWNSSGIWCGSRNNALGQQLVACWWPPKVRENFRRGPNSLSSQPRIHSRHSANGRRETLVETERKSLGVRGRKVGQVGKEKLGERAEIESLAISSSDGEERFLLCFVVWRQHFFFNIPTLGVRYKCWHLRATLGVHWGFSPPQNAGRAVLTFFSIVLCVHMCARVSRKFRMRDRKLSFNRGVVAIDACVCAIAPLGRQTASLPEIKRNDFICVVKLHASACFRNYDRGIGVDFSPRQ